MNNSFRQSRKINRLQIYWLVYYFNDYIWQSKGDTVNLPILNVKRTGCQNYEDSCCFIVNFSLTFLKKILKLEKKHASSFNIYRTVKSKFVDKLVKKSYILYGH